MLELVVQSARPQFAIGLGTATSFALSRQRGLIQQIPSRIAWSESRGRNELSIGIAANALLASGAPDIRAISPMRGGSIANFRYTRALLGELLNSLELSRSFGPISGILGVSPRSSDVERVALREAASAAGVEELHLFWEPILAAIGAGLPIEEPRAVMVVDVGAGATTVTVISLGGIILHSGVLLGGDALDERIINYVRSYHGLAIDRQAAKLLRSSLGLRSNPSSTITMTIEGRKPSTNLHAEAQISESDISRALSRSIEEVAIVIRDVYELLPPEVALDVADYGALLLGGASESGELDVLLGELTSLPIIGCESPMTAIIDGAQMVLHDWDRYAKFTLPPDY